MLDSRKVVGRRGQLLVPLGARVRDHLGVTKGDQVYWHVGRKGDVALTSKPMRPGGRARATESCARCTELDKKVRELTGLLHSSGAAQGRQFFNQGYMTAARHIGNPAADLAVLVDLVKSIRADVPRRRRPGLRASPMPPASAPPPSEVVEGEAVAPGEPLPQGHP